MITVFINTINLTFIDADATYKNIDQNNFYLVWRNASSYDKEQKNEYKH